MTDSQSLPSPFFQFKQFRVYHDNCAMKVNTDGILLGAWVNIKDKQQILDIGSGTGLIALMLAQRTVASQAQIAAVELDQDAAKQAELNVKNSPWHNRISIHNADVLRFNHAGDKFDLLVSNPPYFVDSLKSSDPKRLMARHTDTLTFENLLSKAAELARNQAEFCLILPNDQAEHLISLSTQTPWRLTERCTVSHQPGAEPIRCLLRFSNHTSSSKQETPHINLRDKHQNYSDEFTALCRDFYLKM